MQLLMSIHVHSQKKLGMLFFVLFFRQTVQAQKQNRISSKWQHHKKITVCQCLLFFDFLWDLCGERDWDLDFFPDFFGDLDRDLLDLLGVLEPEGDLKIKWLYLSRNCTIVGIRLIGQKEIKQAERKMIILRHAGLNVVLQSPTLKNSPSIFHLHPFLCNSPLWGCPAIWQPVYSLITIKC